MRRSKEDAQQTRIDILDAAEQLFAAKGVSAVTLEAISCRAGVTRGAFYWHFKDKSELLTAIHERRMLPQEQMLRGFAEQGHQDPLGLLETAAHDALRQFESDPNQQLLFRIMNALPAEDEEAAWMNAKNGQLFTMLNKLTDQARALGLLSPQFTPQEAAVMLMATMSGLISGWLRSGKAFPLFGLGAKIVSTQISVLRTPR